MQKDYFLGLRIKHETKKILLKKAEEEGRTLSNYVRLVLDKQVKEAKKNDKE